LILLEHDLSVVQQAVMHGRRTVRNVSKYILMGSSSNFGNMFSMAGAAVFLPFLPMLPTQVLLNNLLYDTSQIAIPFDDVDPEDTALPVRWDMRLIEHFMLVFGPLSSVFDFITFYMLLRVFEAGEALFHTGWFIESLATQVLVVFAIRTRRPLLRSRPHFFLGSLAFGIVGLAAALPFSPVAAWLGLVGPSTLFFLYLAGAIVVYLALVEAAKLAFYKLYARQSSREISSTSG
jgi:Mg2+-importing ATPase